MNLSTREQAIIELPDYGEIWIGAKSASICAKLTTGSGRSNQTGSRSRFGG